MSDKINEKTFESRMNALLKNGFPTFEELGVQHQEIFSFNFGHANVTVNGNEPSSKGNRAIYDILLVRKSDNRPLILLELKKQNLALTEEDKKQGLSYARLTNPITPITVVSNTVDTILYNTYSGEEIRNINIDEKLITEVLNAEVQLAREDLKNAIEILINRNPEAIIQLLNDISKEKFQNLKGGLSDFKKPICEDFIIDRDIVNEIEIACIENNLIGIIGHSFSGKTVILYDLFKRNANNKKAFLYIDFSDLNYSIFQQLANYFTSQFRFQINKDKVREWIINSLHSEEETQFTFLLDNFSQNIPKELQAEIIELSDLLKGSKHTIIFTIDLLNYNYLTKNIYRNYTNIFGKSTKLLHLTELNINEFEKVNYLLFEASKSFFDQGSYYSIEYRHPRIIRQIASVYSQYTNQLLEGQGGKILAVPDFDLLKLFSNNKSYSTELKSLFKNLSKAYLLDRSKNSNHELELRAIFGGISLSSTKEVFGNDISDLFKSGFVNKYELSENASIIFPKIPELIAYYNIEHISEILISKYKDKDVSESYKDLEKLCLPFLYSDIVGTGVLLNIAYSGHIDFFSELVHFLTKIKPQKTKITDGTKIAMLFDEKTKLNIEFKGEDFDEGFIGNFFAFSVLSQLVGYPLSTENANKGEEFDFHLQIIFEVASSPVFLGRITNFTFDNLPSIETYEFKDIGTVVSGKNGIIEPIVQSIQKCFYNIPEQIERLYNFAIENNEFALLWRIYLAVRNEVQNTDPKIANNANKFMLKFNEAFPVFFGDILTKDIEDEDLKKQIKQIIKEKR